MESLKLVHIITRVRSIFYIILVLWEQKCTCLEEFPRITAYVVIYQP